MGRPTLEEFISVPDREGEEQYHVQAASRQIGGYVVGSTEACRKARIRNPAAVPGLVRAAADVYTYAAALYSATTGCKPLEMVGAVIPEGLHKKLDDALIRYRTALATLGAAPGEEAGDG
jgi:hypothetical protein